MKVNKTLCDLCKTEKDAVATLSVPQDWLPEYHEHQKHKVPDSDRHLFLSSFFDRGPSNPTFDVCRPCTESLLQSAMWLKAVTEGRHEESL